MGGVYEWPDLDEMVAYLFPALRDRGLQVIDVSCANSDYYQTSGKMIRAIRPLWDGVILGGASLSADQAEEELQSGLIDLVTWGRAFIANPDLASRMQARAELVPFEDSMRDTLI
jgi:N-ethylmaleimide reductase